MLLILKPIRIVTVLALIVFSNIAVAEGKYQVFVGNGVRTNFTEMIENFAATRSLVGDEHSGRQIGWNLSVNTTTFGGLGDAFEVLEQFLQNNAELNLSWSNVVKARLLFLALQGDFSNFPSDTNQQTLLEHVSNYEGAISNGDSVLIVPHSQGNWYALNARDLVIQNLNSIPNIGSRISAYHVATPTNRTVDSFLTTSGDITSRDFYLTNDIDFISLVPGSLSDNSVIEYKENILPRSDDWWRSSFAQLRIVAAHSYVGTYANPRLKLSDQLTLGIRASLDRLDFPSSFGAVGEYVCSQDLIRTNPNVEVPLVARNGIVVDAIEVQIDVRENVNQFVLLPEPMSFQAVSSNPFNNLFFCTDGNTITRNSFFTSNFSSDLGSVVTTGIFNLETGLGAYRRDTTANIDEMVQTAHFYAEFEIQNNRMLNYDYGYCIENTDLDGRLISELTSISFFEQPTLSALTGVSQSESPTFTLLCN